MTHTKTKFAVAAAAAAIVATPIVWQETVIANTRDANRTLAAGIQTRVPSRAQPAPGLAVAGAGDDAAREREELDRLRDEIASLNTELQQVRAARIAASTARGSTEKTRPSPPPGFVSLQDAHDVGAATPEALMQTFAWALFSGSTNRLLQLVDFPAESASDEFKRMLTELPQKAAEPEFRQQAANIGFRPLREVPLPDGDVALVLDAYDPGQSDAHRSALRVRRAGNEWRLVGGRNGPEEVKLSEEFMRD